jgi:hypothetical protein
LDGNLITSRAELLRGTQGEAVSRARQADVTLARFDANNDGAITVAEVASAPDRFIYQERRVDTLFALDPNKDGRLTVQELRSLILTMFARVDSDSDGRLSASEYAAISDRVNQAQLDRAQPICDLPAAPPGSVIVAYAALRGQAVSSLAIGSQRTDTNVTQVNIEPGAAPVYLVLSSYKSMLWHVTGATSRIVRVAVSARVGFAPSPATVNGTQRVAATVAQTRMATNPPSASGIIGLPADKVLIAPMNCMPHSSASKDVRETRQLKAAVRRALGREPDMITMTDVAVRVDLSSGALVKAPPAPPSRRKGFDPGMLGEALRVWPAGLVTFDPREVISSVPVSPYKVLPNQMGLAQLLGAGSMERVSDGKFKVVRPIAQLPPAMYGPAAISIVIGDGVPMPPGEPGNACVLSEQDWRKLTAGSPCPKKQLAEPIFVTVGGER